MSESLPERLSRFTPDAAGLDRDGLLFAAGRASARPNRRWLAMCGALAACQALTLGVWCWPRTEIPPASVPAVPLLANHVPPPVMEALALWQLREQAIASEGNLPSVSGGA